MQQRRGERHARIMKSAARPSRGMRRADVVRRGIAERPIAPVHTLWRAARRWLGANTFTPQWLPPRWSVPGAPYALAALFELAAALLTLALFAQVPSYSFPGTIEIMVVALIALSMGGGPSLMATLAGLVVLEFLVMPHVPSGALHFPQDSAQLAIFLVVGVIISLVAGGVERARQRLRREQAAAQARELATHQMNQRVDEFLSILSHELRSPLAGIKAALQLADRRLSRLVLQGTSERSDAAHRMEQTLGTLAIAEREVERQNRLISDLLDISRIRAGKLEYHMARVDLTALLGDAIAAQRLAWPNHVITLAVPEVPVEVCADPDRIAQVVTNFVTNALKYAPADQPVEVTLDHDSRAARIAVRDHGRGLSAEQQRHIWDRFHRVPGVRQQSGSAGLGLGLYICKNIVEHHGGSVGVESAPGRGATFWMSLPLKPSCASADSA